MSSDSFKAVELSASLDNDSSHLDEKSNIDHHINPTPPDPSESFHHPLKIPRQHSAHIRSNRGFAGRALGEIDSSFTGSTDLSGETKTRVEHHRVDDLNLLEETYKIGKKLGQYVIFLLIHATEDPLEWSGYSNIN